jgi:hypothetical protein
MQFWESVSTRVQPTQAGLTLQINTSAGGVLPGSPLGTLLTAGPVGPSDLVRKKQLLSEAQQLLKGAKVSCTPKQQAQAHLAPHYKAGESLAGHSSRMTSRPPFDGLGSALTAPSGAPAPAMPRP